MNANSIRKTHSDARVKMSASNSSLMKCSNVHSKETPSEQNIPRRSLSNKENEIGWYADDKQTNRSGSVEEGFHQNSSSVENSFNEKPNLPKNPVFRTGEKPHVCKICEIFQYECLLKNHHWDHSVECPCKCDACGKGFCQNFQLDAHLIIRTDEWSFACEKCDKKFK
ncbi:uncharacterized protein TNIN_30571 [Trichonephila inaurata madagascariensis]|uniref:C2H2-type domain-containing protein n=1 Tax=Trichonephila inaurata madagascariensis TaxID=2747483 RepID=A0A8X7C220_9ARAC|nr:uncharacterized protein TNIN_30571 [Trichonephila inaurata madagascariensis]